MNLPVDAGSRDPLDDATPAADANGGNADAPATDRVVTPSARGSLAAPVPLRDVVTPVRRPPAMVSPWKAAAVAFFAALVVGLVVYLVVAVPGSWLSPAPELAWSAADVALARGSAGQVSGDELIVVGADDRAPAVVSLNTDFRADEYNAIAWRAVGLPDGATARLIWRTDVEPRRVNSLELRIVSGRVQPMTMRGQPRWIGRVTGMALAIEGPLPEPVRIRGVVAKPLGAAEMLRDRMGEWFAFEGWTGTSINSVTGGADTQDLPLPVLVAVAIALAGIVILALARFRPGAIARPRVAVAALLVLGWLLLDARWTVNLARQAAIDAIRLADKDPAGRRLASEDGELYAFVQKARDTLPASPARIFVVSDAHYFRGRAAYHLLPHRVFWRPTDNAMPAPDTLHAGDWLLVYRRKGVQYDPAQQTIRWDNGRPLPADLRAVGPGAALFEIR